MIAMSCGDRHWRHHGPLRGFSRPAAPPVPRLRQGPLKYTLRLHPAAIAEVAVPLSILKEAGQQKRRVGLARGHNLPVAQHRNPHRIHGQSPFDRSIATPGGSPRLASPNVTSGSPGHACTGTDKAARRRTRYIISEGTHFMLGHRSATAGAIIAASCQKSPPASTLAMFLLLASVGGGALAAAFLTPS